jgi:hypothetical protein
VVLALGFKRSIAELVVGCLRPWREVLALLKLKVLISHRTHWYSSKTETNNSRAWLDTTLRVWTLAFSTYNLGTI